MKAIFKPEDADKLIVRDADINEASLVTRFLNIIKEGGSLEAKATYNGNYEVNGILFSVEEAAKPEDTPIYIETSATVVNDIASLPVFKINVASTDGISVVFKTDEALFDGVKSVLESLGLTDVSLNKDEILANNETGAPISASIVLPKGLFQFVNPTDSTTNNFNDNLVVTLGE